MSTSTIEERLAAVETKLEQLQREKEQSKGQDSAAPWWEQIRGQFKDDPIYDEAMRLGREWRESEDVINEDVIDEGKDKC